MERGRVKLRKRCRATRSAGRLMHLYLVTRKRAYRRRFYWQIRWARVHPSVKTTLARLRWCESTNNPRATNGSHWGYYQYDMRTWGEAQSWAGVPSSMRTGRADFAHPLHQNVVTARFFPSHRGRWACSA